MSVSTPRTPKYRLHKGTGQALVQLSGQRFYLGIYGSAESQEKYRRLVAEWLASNGQLSPSVVAGPQDPPSRLTVTELSDRYWIWAESYYRKDGQPTGQLTRVQASLRVLRELYGKSEAASFGPLGMRAIQQSLIGRGNCRNHINGICATLRRVFKWAASLELLPVSVFQALQTVPGLKRGRTEARESAPVLPVTDDHVERTLPYLPPVVCDMVQVQRLIGCRPTELCIMRPCDLDRTSGVWLYAPSSHKTQHHGRERRIAIGPKAQAILLPYLLRPADAFCFSPAESDTQRHASMRARRKTKVQPSQRNKRKRHPLKQPQDRYTKDSYNRAVARACAKAAGMERRPLRPEPPKGKTKKSAEYQAMYQQYRAACKVYNAKLAEVSWSPNQLRHAAATEIRRRFGIEAAQVALGHSKADVTQLYAERDYTLASKVAAEIG